MCNVPGRPEHVSGYCGRKMHVFVIFIIYSASSVTNALRLQWVYIIISRPEVFVLSILRRK